MIAQVQAFADEVTDLAAVLARLGPEDWARVTRFRGWTVEDVVLHLYASDYAALAAVRSPEAFAALRAEMQSRRRQGLSMIEESRERFPRPRGAELLAHWMAQAADLAVRLDALDPKARLGWSGPSMSVKMFATARQMETWAHGQEIYDLLGLDRSEHDRIGNIALIGVRTLEWSFRNRGLAAPVVAPQVQLVLPSGYPWSAGDPESGERICGPAVDFCQVVTQVRNVADTRLEVVGEVARRWMSIAQCFAGPPVDPPSPGTRRKEHPSAAASLAAA